MRSDRLSARAMAMERSSLIYGVGDIFLLFGVYILGGGVDGWVSRRKGGKAYIVLGDC